MVAHGYSGFFAADDVRTKGVSPEQSRMAARRRMEKLAFLLDNAIRVPGTSFRIGLDGVLGLVPGVGDAAGSLLSLWLVAEAYRLGMPKSTLARMLGNIGLDFAVGAVPVLGDLFDFAFKASTRNMRIIRRHLDRMDGPVVEGRYERRN